MRLAAALLAVVPLAGCLSTDDYDMEHDEPDARVVGQLKEKNQLETKLANLTGCNCSVDLQPRFVRVTVLPSPKGLPDAEMVRRMMLTIVEVTGTPPPQQLILAPGGKVLASGGKPAP
jgi:hypothetical protein